MEMFKMLVLLVIALCLSLSASLAMAAPDLLSNWAKTPTTLTFYGQSTFVLTHGETRLIIDPWLTGNPWKVANADDIDVQYILVSHAHGDHIGDAASIAKRTGAKLISTSEITRMLGGQGVTNVHPMSIGGKWNFEFGWVKVTNAVHGSGVAGGQAAGFVINFFGQVIYFAGDTALFSDMAYIGKANLDYALLPIGDNYTMGPEDATEAVGLLKPKKVIPIHYNTNPLIKQNPQDYKKMVQSRYNIPVLIMNPGTSITL
jgi:L-ascorbate metabolism protein UlaG (beta-lactamase superfamily)